ncbi:hypothetical protein BZG36_03177 [Bifiguratus adelaidae]|uniref:Uncharacterized protein n=1 Tax=Bifiguratus adelaidae TaxID=1938954 RepID=A0A261XYJ9_9FUNG|nr:hypothetical protein BZG36_03177 [Bifiguratus adelaidae]
MSLVIRPNRVPAQQALFQAPSHTPLYLKGPRDRFFVFTTFGVLGLGLIGALYGATKMARGQK